MCGLCYRRIMRAFHIAKNSSTGRGLYATQPIEPGDEIFCEDPAYWVKSCEGKSCEQEGHETLAAHILASATPSHRQAISELVSNVDHFRKQEQHRQAVAEAVEPVRKLIRGMPIHRALSVISPSASGNTVVPEETCKTIRRSLEALAASVSEEVVWRAFGKDWSNAMTVHFGLSATCRGAALYPRVHTCIWACIRACTRIHTQSHTHTHTHTHHGSAPYPQHGAVMNHSNRPTCNLVFDEHAALHVRCMPSQPAPILLTRAHRVSRVDLTCMQIYACFHACTGALHRAPRSRRRDHLLLCRPRAQL